MMSLNTIQQSILSAWQRQPRVRTTPGGWFSANAVCCHHQGHNPDRRGRGGMIASTDGSISYSCFNCGFRAHYRPGLALNYKMRKLMSWLGFDSNQIRVLVLEAIRSKESLPVAVQIPETEIVFQTKDLPGGSQSFAAWAEFYALRGVDHCPPEFLSAVDYVAQRNIDMSKYEFHWTDTQARLMNHRVIVPFWHQNQIVGYSARATQDRVKPKYLADTQPGYVFNLSFQQSHWHIVIVCEGIFDALSIDGCAVMHNEISEAQADQIDNLSREIIVVPDWDTSGRNLVEQAIEYNWAVSFPHWRETCKDINEAVCKYGKLFVLKDILDTAEHSALKIQLWSKRTRWNNA